jgi:GNAT superfamily N-acetyltransferase
VNGLKIASKSDDMHISIGGREVSIRPIRATDTRIESEFVRGLSPQTKHYRFMCGLKELSPEAVDKFCRVDGDHAMAYVATIRDHGQEVEIGVSRFTPGSQPDSRELALTVADAWQNQGLEMALTRPLIDFARQHGVRRMYSVEFADNTEMRELAHELGMNAKPDPEDASQIVYSLAL